MSAEQFPARQFSGKLATWFETAQRDLPWRHAKNARDPYRVLVSEVMLQQTTVAAVIPFYKRFLKRFPTVQSLAEAPLDDVMPLWAGLGYYSRARMLHRCAQTVVEKHGGVFPPTAEEINALPGIGRYTAGAVASISRNQKAPIVDANVARVFSRIFLVEGDLKNTANQKNLWQRAEQIVQSCDEEEKSPVRPSVVNPALMELGALICTPRSPACARCPVQQFCGAFKTGRQNELPHRTPKRQTVELRDVCAFIFDTSTQSVLLRQRAHDEKIWWRGMWELPRTTRRENETAQDALLRLLQDELGLGDVEIGQQLKAVTHGVTHHHITLECWSAEVSSTQLPSSSAWYEWDETAHLALPSSMRSLLKWLQKHGGNAPQKSLFE